MFKGDKTITQKKYKLSKSPNGKTGNKIQGIKNFLKQEKL